MEHEEKEVILKRKLWVKWSSLKDNHKWEIIKAQGFYPTEESWTADELRAYLRENDDIEIHLSY